MSQCSFIKPNNEQCKRTADGPNEYCWAHDPKNAEARRRMASRAARGKVSVRSQLLDSELESIKAAADTLAERAQANENALAPSVVNAVVGALNLKRACIDLQRAIPLDDLEERVKRLERGE